MHGPGGRLMERGGGLAMARSRLWRVGPARGHARHDSRHSADGGRHGGGAGVVPAERVALEGKRLMVPRIALSGIGLDVLAWHALPAVFLFLYVSGNFLPADAVGPHLRVVWLALLPLVVLRLGVALLGLRAGAARVA